MQSLNQYLYLKSHLTKQPGPAPATRVFPAAGPAPATGLSPATLKNYVKYTAGTERLIQSTDLANG